MNRERVKSIFLTLTGEKEATPFLLYIDSAVERVSRFVKPEYQEYPADHSKELPDLPVLLWQLFSLPQNV